MMQSTNNETMLQLVITFRGTKIEYPLTKGTTIASIKESVVEHADASLNLCAADLRLMHKGKLLKNDQEDLYELLLAMGSQKLYRLIATGVSKKESAQAETELRDGLEAAPRIRDDLTEKGKKDLERKKKLGRQMMQKAGRNGGGVAHGSSSDYGFGQIETLPNLPNRDEARRILESLANDPGVLACMAKHKWKVGSLAELYPEGKVGESEVCVMGLNENQGMRILLRVRTDDLKGFRKMLSIRKVLFHELAHNVHSEHDGKFFQLMRQIDSECNEMDWTKGTGLTEMTNEADPAFEGGTFRLGGNVSSDANNSSSSSPDAIARRELAARAAMQRMTVEEEQIENNCGCGHKNLFLPPEKDDAMEE